MQPYLVKGSIRMQWHRSGLIASWQFWEENQPPTVDMLRTRIFEDDSGGVIRWGAMVILTSLQVLSDAVGAALKDTEGTLTQTTKVCVIDDHGTMSSPRRSRSFVGAPSGFGNVLHVALVGINNQMSAFQDRWACHLLSHVQLILVCLRWSLTCNARALFYVSDPRNPHLLTVRVGKQWG